MNIKVKHILLVLFMGIIVIILYKVFKKPIKEIIAEKKYAEKIINFSNLKSFESMSKATIDNYNYYKNYHNEPDIDITPLIESCIKQVESNEEHPAIGEFRVNLTLNIRRTIECEDYTYYTKLYHGINRIASISELEKI